MANSSSPPWGPRPKSPVAITNATRRSDLGGFENRLEKRVSIQKMRMLQLWPWTIVMTGDFYGIIHSINAVFLVLITGILGHNCGCCWWFFSQRLGWHVNGTLHPLDRLARARFFHSGRLSSRWCVEMWVLFQCEPQADSLKQTSHGIFHQCMQSSPKRLKSELPSGNLT